MTPEQEQLVLDHLDVVSKAVGLLVRRRGLPSHVDKEDLEGAGRVGLVQAALRFKQGTVPFGGYAYRRVQGAVLDYMRASSPVSRAGWKKIKDGDLSHQVLFVSTDALDFVEQRFEPRDSVAHATLSRAVDELPERLRYVVRRCCYDGEKMKHVGTEIGTTEGRVSQLLLEARTRLRRAVTRP